MKQPQEAPLWTVASSPLGLHEASCSYYGRSVETAVFSTRSVVASSSSETTLSASSNVIDVDKEQEKKEEKQQ